LNRIGPFTRRSAGAGVFLLLLTGCSSNHAAKARVEPTASAAAPAPSLPAATAALAAKVGFVVASPTAARPVVNATLIVLAGLPGVRTAQSTPTGIHVTMEPGSTRSQRLAVLAQLAGLGSLAAAGGQ
jgi:hypothetical protein